MTTATIASTTTTATTLTSLVLFAITATAAAMVMSSKKSKKTKPSSSSSSSTTELTKSQVLQMRRQYIIPSVSISYSNTDGLMIMKGQGTRLYDESGQSYLDTRNNVCHVGHCHPTVAQAVSSQVATLNTNTRYLHPTMVQLAKRIVDLCPSPLEVVVFVNSGSEANDMALRLARAHANGSRNVICFDGAYHGHTLSILDISPYKYEMGTEYTGGLPHLSLQYQNDQAKKQNQPNGGSTTTTSTSTTATGIKSMDSSTISSSGSSDGTSSEEDDNDNQTTKKHGDKVVTGMEYQTHNSHHNNYKTPAPYVWQCPRPDVYRGPYRYNSNSSSDEKKLVGEKYAEYVEEACDYYKQVKHEPVSAIIMEGGLSIGGCILPPPGFLRRAVRAVRNAGGLWIADEVQTGLGRCGTTFWAWQQGMMDDEKDEPPIVPDIQIVGKPLGNGMPLAAVVMTREVADTFHRLGVDYFNTFGGNPVCAAAGLAVLDVIEHENLQQNALEVGTYLQERFRSIQTKQMKAYKDNGVSKEEDQEQMTNVLVGDVRGAGLFVGVELVTDFDTLAPATKEISYLCTTLKQKYHILTTIDGQYENVLIVKPPLVFSKDDVDYFVNSFEQTIHDMKTIPKTQMMNMSKTPT